MKLSKAVELGEIAKEGFPVGDAEEYYKAMELLIEAGKEVKEARLMGNILPHTLLPGETKE